MRARIRVTPLQAKAGSETALFACCRRIVGVRGGIGNSGVAVTVTELERLLRRSKILLGAAGVVLVGRDRVFNTFRGALRGVAGAFAHLCGPVPDSFAEILTGFDDVAVLNL